MSESVRATLESRRPTLTREHTAQLVASYRHRAAGSGVDTRHAASSWIKEMGYNSEAQQATMHDPVDAQQPHRRVRVRHRPRHVGPHVADSSSVGQGLQHLHAPRPGNTSIDVATCSARTAAATTAPPPSMPAGRRSRDRPIGTAAPTSWDGSTTGQDHQDRTRALHAIHRGRLPGTGASLMLAVLCAAVAFLWDNGYPRSCSRLDGRAPGTGSSGPAVPGRVADRHSQEAPR